LASVIDVNQNSKTLKPTPSLLYFSPLVDQLNFKVHKKPVNSVFTGFFIFSPFQVASAYAQSIREIILASHNFFSSVLAF
jgi:hypothetical protein